MTLQAPMRCSALAEELAEPMSGTVDVRPRWLLVEDRGAWGEKAVAALLGAAFEAKAKERGVRVVLVRRREGDPAADAVRRVFLVDTERARMSATTVEDLAELEPMLDADPEAVGAPWTEPLLLVCTNGKRDACCALRGRALVSALAADHAGRTWECTHLGGHRFAANLVCLPHGVLYGRVPPGEGRRVADAYLAGRVDPALLRGRSAWPGPAQVAEATVRLELGLDRLDDVRLDDWEIDGDTAVVRLGLPDGAERTLRLEATRIPPRPTSCRADELEAPLHWAVVDEASGRAPRTA
jgi:hypothetical protein